MARRPKLQPSRTPPLSSGQRTPIAYLEYARNKVSAFVDEIDRLSESEFPYRHSREALGHLKRYFTATLVKLKQLDEKSDAEAIRAVCSVALGHLFSYLPRLGFALRSTNVRNAFEVFGPFLRLAGDILEPRIPRGRRRTRLLLSSEWEYSPLTYPRIPGLPNFVLIGLPAPESSNPLLLPLAGHELGHAVWGTTRGLVDEARIAVNTAVVAAFKRRSEECSRIFHVKSRGSWLTSKRLELWGPAAQWSLTQASETFCDFLGLAIFGNSYLHAFAYLLAPGAGRNGRVVHYPSMRTRATNLGYAAAAYGVPFPDDYELLFDDEQADDLLAADAFRLSIADEALPVVRDLLLRKAQAIVRTARLPPSLDDEVQRIYSRLRLVVPAERCRSLADILNAGWQAYVDRDFWRDVPHIGDRKRRVLQELILKNIEVFQIEQKLGART